MPFPASIALAVLKYRIKITENNKDDGDNNVNDENDFVSTRRRLQHLLEGRYSFVYLWLLQALNLYRTISLKKCFGIENKIMENRFTDKLYLKIFMNKNIFEMIKRRIRIPKT